MDLFFQFFVVPKFDKAKVLCEATAVDFEYQQANRWSLFAFDQAVFAGLNSTHKAARFFIGTNLVPTNVGLLFNNLGTNVIADLKKDKNKITIAFVINPIPYSCYQTALKFLDDFFTTTEKGYFNDIIATMGLATHLDYKVRMQNRMLQLLFRFHAVKNSYTAATELMHILFAYLNAIKTQGITQE
ncbi:hypothetical protein DSO57_1026139 [Entomophthora muscae]|uniref:Uncharacterized protein n=1 Tax=Entomophthora muscae TaxID=34485 RepID=A0ACC2TCZ3_9FUNG|nr:hypothetical protein DSO57_1026139 [Entomophthora muscae]